MDYQPNHAIGYGEVERVVLSPNSENWHRFIDLDPTMVYSMRIREAAQARKIFESYLRLYGKESLQHISMRGNMLYLTTEGLSRLEICARVACVPINPKDAKINRR